MPRTKEKGVDDGEWIGLAWLAWCAGERNLAALGRQFDKRPETVKANLLKYSKARAAEVSDVDPTAEYLDGLQHDLREALRTYRDAENPNAKVGALKHASAIRKDMASARGVVTERKSVGIGQDPNLGPLQVEQSGRLELTGDAALAVLAFHENTEPEVDELHSAQADAEASGLPEPEQP